MTAKEEALLFAKQIGESAPVTVGARIRVEIFGKDEIAIAYQKVTISIGIALDYVQKRGENHIGCIKTAHDAYRRMGEERYKEAHAD